MLGKDEDKQSQFMFEIPQEYLLRVIRRTIDFTFIQDKVKDLYQPIGRRAVDTVLLVKMLLIGYWYGIRSERRLEQEVKVNLAYRWFLALVLAERVPDHSDQSESAAAIQEQPAVSGDFRHHCFSLCSRRARDR